MLKAFPFLYKENLYKGRKTRDTDVENKLTDIKEGSWGWDELGEYMSITDTMHKVDSRRELTV